MKKFLLLLTTISLPALALDAESLVGSYKAKERNLKLEITSEPKDADDLFGRNERVYKANIEFTVGPVIGAATVEKLELKVKGNKLVGGFSGEECDDPECIAMTDLLVEVSAGEDNKINVNLDYDHMGYAPNDIYYDENGEELDEEERQAAQDQWEEDFGKEAAATLKIQAKKVSKNKPTK